MFKKAFLIIFFTIYVNSHPYPNQGCPVFQYGSLNGAKIGVAKFDNDRSGTYRMSVNMSAASYLDQTGNIKLELRTTVNDIVKNAPLVYYIYFPSQTHLPKPTRIEFNGRVYCTGTTEEAKPGIGVTNFWANTYTSTGSVGPGVSHYKPEYNPYPDTEYKPTEVVDNNDAPIDILHLTSSSIDNNKINTNNIFPIQDTTPRNSDTPNTTYKTVKIVSNNSTRDCVNTTMVNDNNGLPSYYKNSSYSYNCKEVHTTNTHTVSVTKI